MRETRHMQNTELKLLYVLCCAGATIISSQRVRAAAVWPQFRGTNCAGVSEFDKPPVEFGAATNLLWKTALPSGMSSPCIWEDRIFLTGFVDQKLKTLCLRRRDGKVLWHQFVPAKQIEEVNPDSSPASATAAADGERVYAYFGSYGL